MMPNMLHSSYKILSLLILFIILPHSGASAQISSVRGFVMDANGNPVADADLDFDDAVTGERIITPGDNTDPTGFYTVWVLPRVYHISYAPPPATNLMGKRFYNVDLTSGQDTVINVTLEFGNVISGSVMDSFGSPIGGIDLDADMLSTGQRIYTPDDNSDSLTGAYWIVVPSETYRIRFQPPAGTRWLGAQLDSVPVFADTVINATLEEGFLLSGYVTDGTGSGLENIGIDLRRKDTGEKIYVANKKTDSTGYYNSAVPAGLFELRYVPPSDSRYPGVAVDSFTIGGDLSRNQTLSIGLLLTAFVHDTTGNAIERADLDIIQESTGAKLFTPHDKTDSLGLATIAIPPDIYTVRVQPPVGSIFDRVVLEGLIISGDTTLDFTLNEVQRVNLNGRITDSSGAGLSGIVIEFVNHLTGENVYVPDNETDTSGYYSLPVPMGLFDVEISPPEGSRYVGMKFPEIVFEADTLWNDIVLESGFIFTANVFDIQGQPVEYVDFDFVAESSGLELFTPHDNTDSDGRAIVTVPGDIYTIHLSPPAGSQLEQQFLSGYSLAADTSEAFILKRGSETLTPAIILKQNFPNPFNEGTSIAYLLLQSGQVKLKIYNVLGQIIKEFNVGSQIDGYHVIEWDGTDFKGEPVASGTYFYRLITPYGRQTLKMLVIR